MTHPEELLAGFVDGTLSPQDRAAVDAHLAACARCRGEVAMATAARTALVDLPEVPAPAGIAARALAAVGAPRGVRRIDATPRWYRFAGLAAAAAAALLVFTVVLPRIGGGPSDTSADRRLTEAGGALATNPSAARQASGLEIQDANYDQAAITALVASYQPVALASPFAPNASSPASPKEGTPQQVTRALTCIAKAVPDENGTLSRLIAARFQGTPSYIAVFLEGPGAGQPPDSVAVWVVSAKGCAILSSGYTKL